MFENYIPEPNSGCWLWLGNVDVQGYSRVHQNGRWFKVSRLICDAQPGELACHHCDQPSCVNPEHIYRGTLQSNVADMVRRGRQRVPIGVACPQAKFTAEQVRAIRADPRPQRTIAADYGGVSQMRISEIKRRISYADVK